MNCFPFTAKRRQEFLRPLFFAGIFFFSLTAAHSQKTATATFELPDRTVTILVPEAIKVEQVEGGGYRLSYNVEGFVDPEVFENRMFVEMRNTYKEPKKATTSVLEMAPLDKEAVLHVWNPDERCAYVTFNDGNTTVDLNSINYKGAEEKFAGDVKSIGFSTILSLDPGEHVVEIRKFETE